MPHDLRVANLRQFIERVLAIRFLAEPKVVEICMTLILDRISQSGNHKADFVAVGVKALNDVLDKGEAR